MKILATLSIAVAAAAQTPPPLTFEQAVELASRPAASAASQIAEAELGALRWKRLPSVRIESTGNASRTLDLFAEGPLESRYATSVIAFDYPLWDGGSNRLRFEATERKLRDVAAAGRMDDARYEQLVNAFADLYLTQHESSLLTPVLDQLAREADESEELLRRGEISNVAAAERREAALSLASRQLELEARRVDAAARLRALTGIDHEPSVTVDVDAAIPDAGEVVDDRARFASVAVTESRARLGEVEAASGFRAMLSGFAGIGAASSHFRDITSDGSFGVYGLRLHLSYPLIGGVNSLAVAEARADLARNLAYHDAAIAAADARAAELRLHQETAAKRVELLARSVAISRDREASLERLVAAGMRPANDIVLARAERIRREADLLAARVDRWRSGRLLARMTAQGADSRG